MGKWRKITCHISFLHHQQFFLCLLWRKLFILKAMELSCWDLCERKARIVLAGQRNEDNENQILCLLLKWSPVLTHSPGCLFGNLFYCQLVNEWSSLAILTYASSASTRYPLVLACGVWDRFQSGFPGDLNLQKSGGWCEQCQDFIPCLPKSMSKYPKWITSSKCPTSTLHKRNYTWPEQMQALIFHLSKIKGVTPLLHVQGEKLVLVVPSSPLPFADIAGNFRCLHSGSDTALFHFFFWII